MAPADGRPEGEEEAAGKPKIRSFFQAPAEGRPEGEEAKAPKIGRCFQASADTASRSDQAEAGRQEILMQRLKKQIIRRIGANLSFSCASVCVCVFACM